MGHVHQSNIIRMHYAYHHSICVELKKFVLFVVWIEKYVLFNVEAPKNYNANLIKLEKCISSKSNNWPNQKLLKSMKFDNDLMRLCKTFKERAMTNTKYYKVIAAKNCK